MRILFLTPYYPPEVGAPQTRLHEAAVRLVAMGHQVTVLTGFPNYPSGVVPREYRGKAHMREVLQGVEVLRTWIYATPNQGFARRLLNHLSYMVSAVLSSFAIAPADVIFVESPPLFDGLAGYLVGKTMGAPYVFNVADLWPQAAVELGALRGRPLVRAAEALEAFIYRNAAKITVVARGAERELLARGLGEKLVYLPNGADTSRFRPGDTGRLRSELALTGPVALYAGTHGMSQALETLLGAAERLPEVTFLLVGDGAEKTKLKRMAGERHLANVRFLDPLPAGAMPDLVAACDLYLISLRDVPLFADTVPSKLYEAMASGKPLVAAVRGETASLIQESGGGLVVPPEDPAAMAEAMGRILGNRREALAMGEAGRRFVSEHFERDRIVARMEAMFVEVVGGRSREPVAR